MDIKLQQRLAQQMVMTPQLQQAIKLLQMSTLELETFVEQELLENPTLETYEDGDETAKTQQQEWDETASREDNATASEPAEATATEPSRSEQSIDSDIAATNEKSQADDSAEDRLLGEVGVETAEDRAAKEMLAEIDWANYSDSYSYSLPAAAGEGRDAEEQRSYETYISSPTSLFDHLDWQLSVGSQFSHYEREIALRILGGLDERGYVSEDIVAVVAEDLEIAPNDVEAVLYKLQELDPPGICARNLIECLINQVNMLGINDPLVSTIIKDFLPKASKNMLPQIAKATKRPLQDVQKALKVISGLEPRPARNYSFLPAETIRPDIFVYRNEDEFTIVVDSSGKQKLRVSSYYRHLMNDKGDARGYLQERFNRARWLVRSIYHRERTLYRVMECIIKFQRPFFESGDVRTLKPLVLRDVADELGVNESTISRATANKYAATPHGTMALRFFFNTSIQREGNDSIASESVREHIRQLITQEDPKRPLSDQALVKLLGEKGIKIARRTVAKYREMMGILSSSARKKTF